jgi:methylated-DNA-[protein]-cysteine S-methyltransferase
MSKKEINSKSAPQALNLHAQIHYGQKGIQSVSLHPSNHDGLLWTFASSLQDLKLEHSINQWFEEYCQKKHPSIELPFDWTHIPSFTQQVLHAVAVIPFGSILTYGQVADGLGRSESARAVGGACGRNPFLLFIPCHRVLDAKFKSRGFSAGEINLKRKLLTFEEAKF